MYFGSVLLHCIVHISLYELMNGLIVRHSHSTLPYFQLVSMVLL